MIEQTKVKPSYAGKCKFCLGEFEKAKMTQHLKHCKERARIETEIAKSPKSKKHEYDGLILPIVNSPRVGVCGYDGPNSKYAREYEV